MNVSTSGLRWLVGRWWFSIAPLRLDAHLFDPPPAYSGQGRPRVVGQRLPNLAQLAEDTHLRVRVFRHHQQCGLIKLKDFF